MLVNVAFVFVLPAFQWDQTAKVLSSARFPQAFVLVTDFWLERGVLKIFLFLVDALHITTFDMALVTGMASQIRQLLLYRFQNEGC
jgi:hypothetical protein